jgi:molecular chaperone HscB
MMDAFDVLQVPARFTIDVADLESRYRELQRALHPDRFVHAQASERRESLSRAMGVNEAYRVLTDDLRRAELLLARAGRRTTDRDAAEPEMLMEIMELREELAEARASRNLLAAKRLSTDVAVREARLHSQLGAAFDGPDPVDAAQLDQAQRALGRMRYYRRFQDEVAALEDEVSE